MHGRDGRRKIEMKESGTLNPGSVMAGRETSETKVMDDSCARESWKGKVNKCDT